MTTESILTRDKFKTIFSLSDAQADRWHQPIVDCCEKYEINSVLRISAFLSQLAHESANFTRTTENLNYSAEGLLATFPNKFTSQDASQYARQPERIANRAYANKIGNGNEGSGDGWNYRGRGLIQLTGKENYENAARDLNLPIVTNPDSAATDEASVLVSGWYWNRRAINNEADRKDFAGVTRRINPALVGQADRERHYNNCLFILSGEGNELASEDVVDKAVAKIDPDNTRSEYDSPTPKSAVNSITESRSAPGTYPNNKVQETPSGHVIELDDTPGAERINFMHRTGSYTETVADGTVTEKSVADKLELTVGDWKGSVGGTYTLNVVKQAFIRASQLVLKALKDVFIEASVKIQLNAPEVSFSSLLTGKQSDIEAGHFVDLSVDNVIEGKARNAIYAETIGYAGDGGGFNFNKFADSVKFDNTGGTEGIPNDSPIFTKPVYHATPMHVGAVELMGFKDQVTEEPVLCYKSTSGWRVVGTGASFTPVDE